MYYQSVIHGKHVLEEWMIHEMLGFFTMEQVFDREVRVVKETVQMVKKNASWIEKTETRDEDLRRLRKDERLDALRDLFYPDNVLAGVMHGSVIHEITVRLTGIHGPFVVGEVDEEPSQEIGLHFANKYGQYHKTMLRMYHI